MYNKLTMDKIRIFSVLIAIFMFSCSPKTAKVVDAPPTPPTPPEMVEEKSVKTTKPKVSVEQAQAASAEMEGILKKIAGEMSLGDSQTKDFMGIMMDGKRSKADKLFKMKSLFGDNKYGEFLELAENYGLEL